MTISNIRPDTNQYSDIPSPYCYMTIMVPEEEQHSIKGMFMNEVNKRRWKHIYKAERKK